MSGHSKWSTIKRKKGALDARRSKMFTKVTKEIAVAVKEGGADPEANTRLRLAIQNAKGVNMPKDNIERTIKKASEGTGEAYNEVVYEGYAPGGIAVIVECTTDNTNRTVANIRHLFSKYGGNLATSGSVVFLFERKGIFTFPQNDINEDDFTLEMIDAGAEDIEFSEGYVTITTAMEDFGNMQKKLEGMNIDPENASLQWVPNTTTELDVDPARKVLKLIDYLEEDDDVQNVYHNLELTDEIAAELEE